MFRGLGIICIPAVTIIGCGFAIKRYFDHNNIAECENFSVSGNLAIKNLQKEANTESEEDHTTLDQEIQDLQDAQYSLTHWENSNVVNKVVKKPPVRNKEWYKNTPNMKELEDEINHQLEVFQNQFQSSSEEKIDESNR